MSTTLKEWLNQTIVELEEERDATPGAVNEDATRALAAMKLALASLEARSRKLFTCSACGAEGLDEPLESKCHCNEDGAHWIESVVYTAPPALMLPEEMPKGLAGQIVSLLAHNIGDKFLAQKIWNVCLAAMLQGAEPVSNRDELPDGWVACSERMPEDEQEVITHNIFGYRHVSFFDEHSGNFFNRLDGSSVDCVEHVLVSHWMPLPAAPQQEVK